MEASYFGIEKAKQDSIKPVDKLGMDDIGFPMSKKVAGYVPTSVCLWKIPSSSHNRAKFLHLSI